MNKKITSLMSSLMITSLFVACGPSDDTKELMEKSRDLFGPIPEQMPGAENDTAEMISLGEKLYHETALSITGTQSCNSCHLVDDNKAGVDNLPTSPGAPAGTIGDRNSPTVYNAGFHIAQFWDGRAEDLVEQAKGPVLNPVEMAMPDEATVMENLAEIEEYPDLFAEAFPDQEESFTYQNMAEAIAAFERTLISRDRFDDFQNGQYNALNELEQEGLQTFIDVGCTTCHAGPLLGGNMYQKSGLVNPYPNQSDEGRYLETGRESDRYVFKVPSLRNVALTFPYFHDGGIDTLEETVSLMGHMQLGVDLEDDQVEAIVAFLNSLSGKNLRPAIER